VVEWQNLPLDPADPVAFMDAIYVMVRAGQVSNRPIYVALAVTCGGHRDFFRLWAGDGGKYWLRVLTEVLNRGVVDVWWWWRWCVWLPGWVARRDRHRVAAGDHPDLHRAPAPQ
jgi:hypothetical protein